MGSAPPPSNVGPVVVRRVVFVVTVEVTQPPTPRVLRQRRLCLAEEVDTDAPVVGRGTEGEFHRGGTGLRSSGTESRLTLPTLVSLQGPGRYPRVSIRDFTTLVPVSGSRDMTPWCR